MNINSNVFIFPEIGFKQLQALLDETGCIDVVTQEGWLLVDDAGIDHSTFCGAGEYFNGPKGAA